ncbi:MAG: hypothetical protein JST08_06950 [Actinobacteria bacterium]|nr:hypothetical protein [Actinomycetota bacterium]
MLRLPGVERLRRPSPGTVIALVALVAAMSGAAVAATNSGRGVIHACVVKSGKEKGLLRIVSGSKCRKGQQPLTFNQTGPVGPAGPAGPTGPVGPAGERGAAGAAATDPTLPPLEAVHFVGTSGEPKFEAGAGNTSGVGKAGFYADQLGIVHLMGEVSGTGTIFTLPPAFRPAHQVCTSASAFKSGLTFVTNRVCVTPAGLVVNDRGEGNEYLSLNALTYRPDN